MTSVNDSGKTQDEILSPVSLEADARWKAVEQVLASQNFKKSGRLSSFLRYVSIRAIEGRLDEINEQQIGLHVFRRPADFNAGEDNIVRSSARQLRQRLAVYYDESGRDDAIRIEIPRGGYVPHFLDAKPKIDPPLSSAAEEALEERDVLTTPLPHRPASQNRLAWLSAVMLSIVAGSILTLVAQYWLRSSTPPPVAHQLWTALFDSQRNTVFVPGDAGLNMYDNLGRTQVSVGEYATGSYLREPAAQTPPGFSWSPLAQRRYATIVDLNLADRIRQLPELKPERYSVRFARDIHLTDFRDRNLILTGAPTYNPWIELFDHELNFHIVYDGATNKMRVLNRLPHTGEKNEYAWSSDDPAHRGYAYIALVDNLHRGRKVLLVEGTTMAGVDAASAFLMNDDRVSSLLKQATSHSKLNNFELLLEASVIDGSCTDSKVVATRIYP